MSDELKLSLERPAGKGGPGKGMIVLLVLVLAASLFNVFLLLSRPGRPGPATGLAGDKLEELALKFEKQKLPEAASRAWYEYIDLTRPGKQERARIIYRVGKIYEDNGEYEKALEEYYRSEQLADLKEIEQDLSMRTARCLEKLGRFASLRSELEERTAIDASSGKGGGEVVAEIGTWKITSADLDAMIEEEIDDQLSQAALGLTKQQKDEQREKLLDTVLKEGEKEKWLDRFVAEELIYRYAMDEKISETADFRKFEQRVIRSLLIQKAMDREFASGIEIDEKKLKDYYMKHQADFTEDGQLKEFQEVRDRVYQALRMEMEMQVQAKLLDRLREKYDVVIHRSKLEGK